MHYLLFCLCVILLLQDVMTANVPIYDENSCGKVIQIGGTSQAGRLIYRYSPGSGRLVCNFTIETIAGYQPFGGLHHVAYTFLRSNLTEDNKCSSVIYYDNGYIHDNYCVSHNYHKETHSTRDNTLELSVVGDGMTEFKFDLLFLSFHDGSCLTDETKCYGLLGDLTAGSGCVYYSIVCDESYIFCQESGAGCADIVSDTGSNGTLIAGIVVTLVVVLLVGVGCYLCYRNNFCGFLKRNGSEDDLQARAMNVFSVQLASRGVDGNDNAACTDDEGGPIDFSKFDPPPEYGSLEHLDNIGTTETDGNTNTNEVLPSYGDVMQNFDNYSVTTSI